MQLHLKMSFVEKKNCLIYRGSNAFRMRLLLSVLSGKPVKINDIRSLDDFPGLREYEVNLIRLLDKITNGTVVELSYSGTSIYFQPGLLHGGQFTHECCKLKGISYYLEVLIALAPFCKKPLNCTLTGVTNSYNEVSIDSIIFGVIPLLKKFIIDDSNLSLKIVKRGMAPEGGGQVEFSCPAKKSLKPVQLLDIGKVKRIRGVAYSVRVSPAIVNRIVEKTKGVLFNFLPDIYINTDHCKKDKAGKSPGFGIALTAETTNGFFLTCDAHSAVPKSGIDPSVPEDVGIYASNMLLEEIYRGGCVSSQFQSLAALWMVLNQKDVSKIIVGPLSPYMIKFLQHIQDFFGVTFKLDLMNENDDNLNEGTKKVILTCLGIGYSNLSRRML